MEGLCLLGSKQDVTKVVSLCENAEKKGMEMYILTYRHFDMNHNLKKNTKRKNVSHQKKYSLK